MPAWMDNAAWRAFRRWIKIPVEARTGRLVQHLEHRRTLREVPPLEAALAAIDDRWGDQISAAAGEVESPEPSPIFILSASWRSGSTLLQRLIMSDPEVLIWGEPYHQANLVQRLSESLRMFSEDSPPMDFFFSASNAAEAPDLASSWIANLYPAPDALWAAHRALFTRLYDATARARGFGRWGLKEVRYDASHAAYLKWLFPTARLLFLVRHPLDAYRSYRSFPHWYDRWPDDPVIRPRDYGRHWTRIASSFIDRAEALEARLIRFEDLTGERPPLFEIERDLDVSLDASVLKRKITGPGPRERPLEVVPRSELVQVAAATRRTAERLGYEL